MHQHKRRPLFVTLKAPLEPMNTIALSIVLVLGLIHYCCSTSYGGNVAIKQCVENDEQQQWSFDKSTGGYYFIDYLTY